MKPILRLCLLAVVSLTAACSAEPQSELDLALQELDKAIALRPQAIELKKERIEFNRAALANDNLAYRQIMEIMEGLIDEYDKYQLDSTIQWTWRAIDLATRRNDHKRADELRLRTSKLYSAAGFYGEAEAILRSIDTLAMSPAEIRNYYTAAHSYYRETREYSADTHIQQQSAKKEEYYINRLIDTEGDWFEKHKLLCIKFSNTSRWEEMSRELEFILPALSPDSRDFALYSYYKALSVGDDRCTTEQYMLHLARSACADMKNCTYDHASISMLSEVLFHLGDVDRAFQYIQIAMNDASFYNSRLRPWQVAAMMPVIESSYREKALMQRQILTYSVVIISVLSLIILVFLLLQRRKNKEIRLAKAKVDEMNRQLGEYVARLSEQNEKEHALSAELSEANVVKEQYIGLFLVICSNYIDLLRSYHNNVRKKIQQGSIESLRKELDKSTIVHEAEEEFYVNFDNAFLNIYPSFVEEFNALLKDDAQMTLKTPRTLNTELRIFALIKLGITDSSRIASLLRYSVNTIYNYRSMVKNNAKVSREEFEDRVRCIGSKGAQSATK